MSNCISTKEPPYAERHVRWCEGSENESRKKTTSFSSYSILTSKLNLYGVAYKPNENLSMLSYTTLAMLSTMMPAVHSSRLTRV